MVQNKKPDLEIVLETPLKPESPDERRSDDIVSLDQLTADVKALLDVLADGGVAIAPLDVAYAILAATPQGIKRIFDAKNRSYEKPSGMFGDFIMSSELHLLADEQHTIIEEMVKTVRLPFSVVAPFRKDHPVLTKVDPFVLRSSSKAGTLDMLLNAGQVHNEIAAQSWAREMPVFGSSANLSLSGSKYRLSEIDEEVLRAADFSIDYGLSKFANYQGRSSTIIDFRDYTVIRIGVQFHKLRRAFKELFDITIKT